MKICTVYQTVVDKIRGFIFAKRIAEEAAAEEAARKKKTIIWVCVGVAVAVVAIAVGIYFLSKNENVRKKVNSAVDKVKAKLPFKKKACEQDAIVEIVGE